MWRPTMFLLCLIAALAGTPLRQVEAAGDLARSLAELDGGDVVEQIDDGVGDDSGETILKPGGPGGSVLGWNAPMPDDGPRMVLPATAPLSSRGDAPRLADRPGPPISDHARRHAWLQFFLF